MEEFCTPNTSAGPPKTINICPIGKYHCTTRDKTNKPDVNLRFLKKKIPPRQTSAPTTATTTWSPHPGSSLRRARRWRRRQPCRGAAPAPAPLEPTSPRRAPSRRPGRRAAGPGPYGLHSSRRNQPSEKPRKYPRGKEGQNESHREGESERKRVVSGERDETPRQKMMGGNKNVRFGCRHHARGRHTMCVVAPHGRVGTKVDPRQGFWRALQQYRQAQ